jgi:hypothetical protein
MALGLSWKIQAYSFSFIQDIFRFVESEYSFRVYEIPLIYLIPSQFHKFYPSHSGL